MKTDIQIAQEAEMMPIRDLRYSTELRRMIWNYTENTKQNFPMS